MKSKRNEVARINIVKDQVEELYFIFNLECRHATVDAHKTSISCSNMSSKCIK
jgi:hypothetical protein